jgi:hypothetical protein
MVTQLSSGGRSPLPIPVPKPIRDGRIPVPPDYRLIAHPTSLTVLEADCLKTPARGQPKSATESASLVFARSLG